MSSLLVSCEGGTAITKIVANHSSDTLKIKLYQSIITTDNFVTILPKENKTVFVLNIERGCTSEIDSVSISVSGNYCLTKDFMDSNNCIWQIDDARNAGETSTITVTDADFD